MMQNFNVCTWTSTTCLICHEWLRDRFFFNDFHRKYLIFPKHYNLIIYITGPCSPSGPRFTMKPLARGFEPPHPHKQLPSKKKKKKNYIHFTQLNRTQMILKKKKSQMIVTTKIMEDFNYGYRWHY